MTTREDILSLAVPAGWKLVPIEPTREMWAAMADTLYGYKNRHHDKVAGDLYKAMLAAAPTRPAAEAPGQEPVEAAGDVSPSYAIAKVIAKTVAASGVTSAMVTEAYRIAPWVGPDIIREMLKAALVSAPPTYADAEAKGFGRGVEAAAKWLEDEDTRTPYVNKLRKYAAAIRSLASPAPKGET